ncbi:mRNA capping enzyme, subunit alpha [Butyriboletus roseoflavus]|nr:mRNA capping enzyme, subunit alpha [Butyriboletus roseoflavus]
MDTILDGELVVDVEPMSKKETLRYLAFDCLVFDNENVMSRSLDKRYGRLKERFYRPWRKVRDQFPQMAENTPFDIHVKDISFSYGIEDVFRLVIPKLQHGNDGLIYTCRETPYVPGTDPNILKWKPPSENSIDFKLVLRFPPSESDPSQPEFRAKPLFGLHVYCGDERGQPKYEPYDELLVEDDEWEKLKLSGEQIDDRIVEVHWDPEHSRWRLMRFRDDKPHGNFRTVVDNIIQSIVDGVERPMLLARGPVIRSAWKARLGQPQQTTIVGPPAGQSVPNGRVGQHPPIDVQLRYGPIAVSQWSKVSGPAIFAGMKR